MPIPRWEVIQRYAKQRGLVPESRLAKFTLYLLGVDVFLILYRWIAGLIRPGAGDSVKGWIGFLAFVASFLLVIVALRWFRRRVMWALRNRLIVAYMFIGVTPVLLLMALGALVVYLFVGQFATYVATSDLKSEIGQLDAVNERLATEIATSLRHGHAITPDMLKYAWATEEAFPNRQLTAWFKGKPYVLETDENMSATAGESGPSPVAIPPQAESSLAAIADDSNGLSLRSLRRLKVGTDDLVVISSVPLDSALLTSIGSRIGVISIGPEFVRGEVRAEEPSSKHLARRSKNRPGVIESTNPLAAPVGSFDREFLFAGTLPVLDWDTGKDITPFLTVRTRPSLMYRRLFETVGDFANVVLYAVTGVAIFFAILELIALIIGVRLTKTITQSVYKLYQATQHINRGDFSHRIKVTSNDQLAALENAFNGMTKNIQGLLIEQQEKQRMENELSIAQEVQAQLFPKGVVGLSTLELYGYCSPARTVSGDYYDFVPVGSDRLVLAVGDISGKGISAALLMATIHSGVRAYSLERAPMIAAASAGNSSGNLAISREKFDGELAPSLLCTMLNRQLYHSTPMEKYATIFLGVYDGKSRKLTYCNGGHLPPLVMGSDGSVRRLDVGGSVVGLFDGLSFQESAVSLHPGDIFIAYSDGVTEPENEFGEFGEDRLLQIVRENQHLPLQRIANIAVSAVNDWIGGAEQPDDVTIVLARPR